MRISAKLSVVGIVLVAAAVAHGQSEKALQKYFETKNVVVKTDLPTGTTIDIYPDREQMVSTKAIASALKTVGVALQTGDTGTISRVTVLKNTIEIRIANPQIQTAGGSYLESGFCIHYKSGKDTKDLTPETVMTTLAAMLDFPTPEPVASPLPRREATFTAENEAGPVPLKLGMGEAEVNALLGGPLSRVTKPEQGPDVVECSYQFHQADVQAHIVDGKLARYAVSQHVEITSAEIRP